jgi:hypothetical protein
MKTRLQIKIEEAKIVGHINLPQPKDNKDGEISKSELNSLEKILDGLFKGVNIDIEFTRHFHDRLNDPRNKKQIDLAELQRLFTKTYKKYGKELTGMDDKAEAVLNDIQSELNLPFVLQWNKKTKMVELIGKTIMRKKNFLTPDKKLKV